MLEGIDRLIADPDAEIWHDPTVTYTVKVLDERGNEVYEEDFDVPSSTNEFSQVEAALNLAFHQH